MASDWTDAGFEAVTRVLRERTGLTFGRSRRRVVEQKIRQAMAARSIAEPSAYGSLIADDPRALEELAVELTVHETFFFREPGQLEYIRSRVIPELARSGGGLRVWSAGCASGEEPYTMAILLSELGLGADSQVLGTDLAREQLERARAGRYSRWSLRGVPDAAVQRYFRRTGARYQLAEEIRGAVEFRYLNLAENRYPSAASGLAEMDLILCRNVLIYLDPETIADVARRLLASLSEGGWLFLGASDPLISELVPCEVVITGAGVAYRPRGTRGAELPPAATSAPPRPRLSPAAPPGSAAPVRRPDPPEPRSRAPQRVAQGSSVSPVPADPDPGSGELAARVRDLANAGQMVEAARMCAAGIDRYGTSAELLYLQAVLLNSAGHHAEAAAVARQSSYLDRRLVMAHMTRAQALLGARDRQSASGAFRTAERLLAALPAESVVPWSDGETAGRMLAGVRLQIRLLSESG